MASYTCNIDNETGATLNLSDYARDVGWKEVPPTAIASGTTGSFDNAGPQSAGGYAVYVATVNGTSVTITLSWSIPAIGSNTCSQQTSPSNTILIKMTGGNCSGFNPTQDFQLTAVPTDAAVEEADGASGELVQLGAKEN
jgi:hypothetical protein